jgi:hypothetical protein
MSKFSNIGNQIKYSILTIENQTLTRDDLDELFNNKDVKTNVYTLIMINCNISTIPKSIINLKPKLRELYLNYNNISELPTNLGKMNLFVLNLTGNPVTVNKNNIDILYEVYNNIKPTSDRINAARPRIFFDNEDRRKSYYDKVAKKMKNESIRVIGNLDLVSGRSNNQGVLFVEDFDKLYSQIGESRPKAASPGPKAASPLPEIQPKTTSRPARKTTARNTKARKSSSSSSSSASYEPSSLSSSASSASSSSSRKKRSTKKKSPPK